ncbi:aspartyl aminopeptidase [Stemphylium lycopersici]|nr:aspartyl aminopeptidase [Stemphylium lycopersici]
MRLQTSSYNPQQGRSGVTSSTLKSAASTTSSTSGLSSRQPLRSSREERAATRLLPDTVSSTGRSGVISTLKPTASQTTTRSVRPDTTSEKVSSREPTRSTFSTSASLRADRTNTRSTRFNTASTSEAPLEQISSAISTSTAAARAVRRAARSVRSNTASTAASTSEAPPPPSSSEEIRARRIARRERTAAQRARADLNNTSSSRSFAFAKTQDVSSEGAPLVSVPNSETQSEQTGTLVRKELTDPFVSRPNQPVPTTLVGKCHAANLQYGTRLGALAAVASPRYTVPADETPATEPLSFNGVEFGSTSQETVSSPSRELTESEEQQGYRERKDRRKAEIMEIEQEDEDSQFSMLNRCLRHKARKEERRVMVEKLCEEQDESLLRAQELEDEKEKRAAEERHARYREVEKARKAAEEIRLRFLEEERKKKAAEETRAPKIKKARFLIITRNKGKPDEQVSKVAVKSWRPSPEAPVHCASEEPIHSASKAPIPPAQKAPIRSARVAPVRPAPEAPIRSAPVAPVRSGLLSRKPKLTIHRGPDCPVRGLVKQDLDIPSVKLNPIIPRLASADPVAPLSVKLDPVVPCLAKPDPSHTLSATNMSVSSSMKQKEQDRLEDALQAALKCKPITYKPVTRYGRFAHETPIHSGPPAFPLKSSKASTLCACEDTVHSRSCLKQTGAPRKQKSVRFAQEAELFEFEPELWVRNYFLYTPHEGKNAERPVQWKTDSDEAAVLHHPYETMWEIALKDTPEEDWDFEFSSRKPCVQFRHASQRHRVEQVRSFYGLQAVEETAFPEKFLQVKQMFDGFYGLRDGGKFSGVIMEANSYPLEDEFHPRSFGKIIFKQGEPAFLSEPFQVNGGKLGKYGRYQCEKGGKCVKFHRARAGQTWVPKPTQTRFRHGRALKSRRRTLSKPFRILYWLNVRPKTFSRAISDGEPYHSWRRKAGFRRSPGARDASALRASMVEMSEDELPPSRSVRSSNADLYAEPSPPRPLQHSSSTLERAHSTASLRHRQRLDRATAVRAWRSREGLSDFSNRHSVAGPYPDLIDVYEDYPALVRHQNPPPVPPKILEAPAEQVKQELEAPRPAPSHPWIPVPARSKEDPARYTKPFTDYMTANPTIFHAVDAVAQDLEKDGYKKLSERDAWDLKAGGKYYVERNGTSLIAFAVGDKYASGNGAAIVAGHIDALTAKLKPIPKLRTKAGYVQLGVAPYAGALSDTWWDRDLGIGGRVLVKENGKIVTKLVKLDWPIAKIPTLAPHFGAAANGPFNKETQMVPIIGLDNSDMGPSATENGEGFKASILGGEGAFASTQPERLVKAISKELGITDYSTIVNWELELFDTQPAQTGGLDKDSAPGPPSKRSSTPPRRSRAPRKSAWSPFSTTKKSVPSSARAPMATSSPASWSA